jgi:hypothetical protein
MNGEPDVKPDLSRPVLAIVLLIRVIAGLRPAEGQTISFVVADGPFRIGYRDPKPDIVKGTTELSENQQFIAVYQPKFCVAL